MNPGIRISGDTSKLSPWQFGAQNVKVTTFDKDGQMLSYVEMTGWTATLKPLVNTIWRIRRLSQ